MLEPDSFTVNPGGFDLEMQLHYLRRGTQGPELVIDGIPPSDHFQGLLLC